ncbi:MAG: hypothetical protein EPN55_06165 [Gammaproteobacteria bacterium]|nr:MAG: hypothetical protein EPN55_06165 [Gammaproteobacteria bacterium]
MEAWLLCDLTGATPSDEWVISPTEVQTDAKNNDTASDLASVIFTVDMEKHQGAWRFTVPKLLRDLGWLPRSGERVIARTEQHGTSFWTESAFRLLYASLPEQWADTVQK